ncbi:MAG: hypothetical protein E7108_01775 [Bacteroidales bacterium]|nr:hypothetical protein [Bacteroidales bacterium]
MKIIRATKEVREKYKSLIVTAIDAIRIYNGNKDKNGLAERLCKVIKQMPKESYLDEDTLDALEIPSDIPLWVRADDFEYKESIENLCDLVEFNYRFDRFTLSLTGSGSILRTIFGAVYQLYLDGEL